MILAMLRWWYGAGWLQAVHRIGTWTTGVTRAFSIVQLLQTLFSPWKRIVVVGARSFDEKVRAALDNVVSRCIGFVIRLSVLIIATVGALGAFLAGIIAAIAWPLLPLAALYCIGRGNSRMSPAAMLDLTTLRARKARLGRRIGKGGNALLQLSAVLFAAAGLYGWLWGGMERLGFLGLGLAGIAATLSLWYRYDLSSMHVSPSATTLDGMLDSRLLAAFKTRTPITAATSWNIIRQLPEGIFLCNHLLVDAELIGKALEHDDHADMTAIWQQATTLASTQPVPGIHAGVLAAAILVATPSLQPLLTALKIQREDIVEVLAWLQRQVQYLHAPKPYFGGIGRDWAMGFTPTLDRFSSNISQSIQRGGGLMPYMAHADLVDSLVNSLAQGNAIALVGEQGVGKSTLVQNLAHHLLTQPQAALPYYQVVSLNASLILSTSGIQLEKLILTLFAEAVAAGNIILFLEDAHLFFGAGVGAFDMSQVLQPLLKNHRIRIIAEFAPADWQVLQSQRPALAAGFASVIVPEPPAAAVFSAAEDTALQIEHRSNTLVSYAAIKEAYRLSSQFVQGQAYPGKLLSLLEQAVAYSGKHRVLDVPAVQHTIEKTLGVRVSQAQTAEADTLLHLEDRIHERMINQTRAVTAVAAALRRGRAGVASPKRPVGSFLFLGPTGVGKTELARSLAAVYYGDEQQMIRLDMSEYQRPEDVSRLLAAGGTQEQSLLLAIRQQPFSVVLFDEIEKAHPTILNLFLQLLDEGQLTDEQGRAASFRSSIIIATSNAGAAEISARVQSGVTLDDFERPLIDSLIAAGQFKPELINRFDEIVLFRPLNEAELALVAKTMLRGVNETLAPQQISVELTPEALQEIVRAGYDPQFGARPMRRVIQKTVENVVAVKILEGQVQPGSIIRLDRADILSGHDQQQTHSVQA